MPGYNDKSCASLFSHKRKNRQGIGPSGDNLDRYAVLLLFHKAANDANLILFN